ncbi:MAG TPA: rRNA pseudouridine synthase [Phycisphaeraceae bacterium]|nr:rRNA pseudouridine synthase [Phycisphaeraceae bacterium]
MTNEAERHAVDHSGRGEMQRLAKVMAGRGICSRRTADRLIAEGLVLVDGESVPPNGRLVLPDAEITVLPEGQAQLDAQLTIMLHKPVGVVSNLALPGQKEAADLLVPENMANPDDPLNHKHQQQINNNVSSFHVAGRLDYESSGMLILTQDGVIARALTGADHNIQKEYIVRVISPDRDDISQAQLRDLNRPIRDAGETLRALQVDRLGEGKLRFILNEGRKHHVRRMCAAVDLQVVTLKRVRIGELRLGNLKPSRWRFLDRKDIELLVSGEQRGRTRRHKNTRRRRTGNNQR